LLRWNNISVEDTEELVIINRGICDEQSNRATTRITGFIRNPDGSYERFSETAFNTIFDMDKVRHRLLDVGWRDVYFALGQDLTAPIDEPEQVGRVFFVARK
jgi:hypothetical protein